jgi:SAM-dependent methyltransferase
MIYEEDSIFSIHSIVTLGKKKISNTKIKNFKKNILNFVPSLSNNLSSKNNFILLEKLLSQLADPKILIIGGGSITTGTERIINSRNLVIESDVYFGPRTQIIIDGHYIPFENSTFDLIIFQAVLHAVADPYKCLKEAHRVLKDDGLIFASTPFMQQVHMKQHDFTRFTRLGHRRLFRSFKEIESGVFAGTGVALGWSIKYFARSLTNSKKIRIFLELCVSFMFFWLKYIDLFTHKNLGSFDGASGFYFIGRKSDTILSDRELITLFKGNK